MRPTLETLVERVREARLNTPLDRSTLVAISGIDGCGKDYITKLLVEKLQEPGLRVAGINVDGWLNLPTVRFRKPNRSVT